MNYIWKKYLMPEGNSRSNGWARVKRERTYSRKCLLQKKMKAIENLLLLTAYHDWYFVIQVTCTINTHETKIGEHWKGPIKRAQVNNLNEWSGWWHKYKRQASSKFYTVQIVIEDSGWARVPEWPLKQGHMKPKSVD